MIENNVPNLGLPLVFMYEGIIYSKEIDGTFHKFNATAPRTKNNSLGSITIDEARKLFVNTKYISSIVVLTDNIYLKI